MARPGTGRVIVIDGIPAVCHQWLPQVTAIPVLQGRSLFHYQAAAPVIIADRKPYTLTAQHCFVDCVSAHPAMLTSYVNVIK